MNNQKQYKLIPELRFPEFVNEGEWNIERLADIGNIQQGFGFPESYQGKKNGEFPFIKVSDISNVVQKGKLEINEAVNYISSDDVIDLKAKTIPIGTTVFAKIGEAIRLNRRAITSCESLIDNNVTGIKAIKDKAIDRFIYYILSKIDLIEYSGGAVPSVNKTTIENIPVIIPQLEKEQQRIADCLSSLDEIITAHSQKLEALKEHKKGLMQNLFPQEGKTIPKLRFPEFVNDGAWEEKVLIDTVDKKVKWSFTGGPFGSNLKASDYTSKGIRIIQLQNIGDGQFNDEYKIYTSTIKADELLSCNIYSGEIILSKMGDPVGRACIIPNNLDRCVMASDGIRLVVNEMKYSKYFIYSLLNSKQIREAIEKKATGSTRKRIGLDELKGIKLMIPKSKIEQQRIADCLSSLDNLITAQAEKIEQLKLHKKGLMQGLFPKINK